MSATANLWFFEDVDLYEMFCPHKIEGMMENHQFNHYKKEEYIYFPKEEANFIYLIAKGRVKIGSFTQSGKENVKAILGPGEIFGEMVMAGEVTRRDFAMALDPDTTVCPLSADDMERLMLNNKPFSFKIMKVIGMRLRKMERKIESLVFKDARTRVIEFLVDLAKDQGQKVGFETMIKNHFSHKDIASLTGTSRQTVTTIMNELRDQNYLTFDRRRILIRDLERLEELVYVTQ